MGTDNNRPVGEKLPVQPVQPSQPRETISLDEAPDATVDARVANAGQSEFSEAIPTGDRPRRGRLEDTAAGQFFGTAGPSRWTQHLRRS